MALFSVDSKEVLVSRTRRDEPPTHFQLRIDSFSLLSKSSLERYDSGNFEAGGYKWKLCLYPKGNKGKNGEGHISLYLEISETDSLSPGWEVHALFRLLLLDQLGDKYLGIQDANGRARRFRASRTQSGFDRLISLKEFNDPTNGYLVDDICVFGAEVFVHRESVAGKRECLLMKAGPDTCNYTWKIDKFSELNKESHFSEVFTAGGHKWRIILRPKGCGEEEGKSLSLFLELNDSTTLLPGRGVYVEYQLRVVDQVDGKHVEKKRQRWFNDSNNNYGLRNFLSLDSFRDQSKGYLVKDVCIVEAHLLLIGVIEKQGSKSEWNHSTFLELNKEFHFSEVFTAGGHKWRIYLYPKGTGQEKGKSLSLFLHLDDSKTLLASRGLYVEVQLRLVDQINGEHVEHKLRNWFNDSSKNWGRRKFLSLNSLRDQSKGYLVKDVCIIEAHFLLVGAIEKLGQRVK
ncbi:uncharacterized protein LOC122084219 [Macadamia integrifolia]|uniref:uncharacterized protein LOC122084219 n=1 Tax=Macadamia integrifolia TaxID=60698 RepID=UPI001C501682|nr:uncharacterized protein LOC122084219 [Macadamia integrifolia]